MRKLGLFSALSVSLLVSATVSADTVTPPAQVTRGGYLVKTMGCTDCHTPTKMGPTGPEKDESRFLSGHPQDIVVTAAPKLEMPWMIASTATSTAYAGPWGVSFSANLTPDRETGLGDWTPQNFLETIRNGRHLGKGRPLLPPMPFKVLALATDEDLLAIFAYLQTIPAIRNRVPFPIDPQ